MSNDENFANIPEDYSPPQSAINAGMENSASELTNTDNSNMGSMNNSESTTTEPTTTEPSPEPTTTEEPVSNSENAPSNSENAPSNSENIGASELTTINSEDLGASELTNINSEPLSEAPTTLASTTTKTKKRRSTKQSEADEGQKQMMELMRDIYRKEFSNIPEKKRPKPKAYVARAAWYKKEGPERDKYIESWILADRDAAEARMGKNVVKKRIEEKEEFSNDYVMDTLPSIVSTANSASANSFKPSTDTLKERAAVAIDKLNELTNETQAKVMSKIKAPIVRGSAKYLFRETRKLNRKLAKEIRKEARQLEAAAKRHVLSESKDAFHKLEKKAEVNLTAALNGRAPTKRMTHRLARIRNSGRGVPVETFLNSEKRKGRFTNKKNPLPKNSNFQNNYSNI